MKRKLVSYLQLWRCQVCGSEEASVRDEEEGVGSQPCRLRRGRSWGIYILRPYVECVKSTSTNILFINFVLWSGKNVVTLKTKQTQ